jgi:predicted branched-subunit amino acid permease
MLGVGVVMFVCWVGATAVGRITGAAIHDPSSFGLDFAILAIFVALLVSPHPRQGTSIVLRGDSLLASPSPHTRCSPGTGTCSWALLQGHFQQ